MFSIIIVIINFGSDLIVHRYVPELYVNNSGKIKNLLKKIVLLRTITFVGIATVGVIVFDDNRITYLLIVSGAYLSD